MTGHKIRHEIRPQGSAAPSFLESKNRRQKARTAGMHPDYWYPVCQSKDLKKGKAMGTESVSYTHLDVYKRQGPCAFFSCAVTLT